MAHSFPTRRSSALGLGQPASSLVGQPVLLLRRGQLWAVDRQQRLPGADPHASLVRVQPLHPAFEARGDRVLPGLVDLRSEEHTSELQSLMRISYAVFCLKKKT